MNSLVIDCNDPETVEAVIYLLRRSEEINLFLLNSVTCERGSLSVSAHAQWTPTKENEVRNDCTSFKIGDVVQLKSGGPNSTVSLVGGGLVEAVWFNEQDDQYRTFRFPDSVLVKIET